MLYSVLAVGDVVGESGLAHLERHLRPLQKLKNISFTVVNGENISATGLTRKQALRVYDAGADAVTLGTIPSAKWKSVRCWTRPTGSCAPLISPPAHRDTAVRFLTATACGFA